MWKLNLVYTHVVFSVMSVKSHEVFLWSLFFINLFYLFLAVLGLRFCARAFSSCGERGPLFIAVRGPLAIAASLVAEHRLRTRRLSSCGSREQPLRSMRDPPRPGLEPVSAALAGGFSTTAPQGSPLWSLNLFLGPEVLRYWGECYEISVGMIYFKITFSEF